MYPETINRFQELVNQCNLSILDNENDLYVYGSIPHKVIGKVRDPFQLHVDEEILWIRDTTFWGTFDQGAVVTDWGITCIPDNEKPAEILQIKWENVLYAEYSGDCIYFFLGNDRNNNTPIHISYFLKGEDEYTDSNAELLAQVFTEIAQTQNFDTAEAAFERMKEYDEQENHEKVIEEADNILSMTEDTGLRWQAQWYKAWAYRLIGWNIDCSDKNTPDDIKQQRNDYMMNALNIIEDMESWDGHQSCLYMFKGDLFTAGFTTPIKNESNSYIARRYYIAALQCDNKENKKQVLERFRANNEAVFNDFEFYKEKETYLDLAAKTDNNEDKNDYLELAELSDFLKFTNDVNFADRQFLLLARDENHIAGMYDPEDNIKWVFTLNQIPSDVEFEGVPQANTLYLAHPVRQTLYLPYEGAEEKLFMDKVGEFCYLVQCLGATEVVFHSNKGMKVSETFNSTQNVNGGFSNPFVDMNGEHSRNNSGKSNHSQRVGIDMIQTFAPTKYPYQPEDLAWLATDSSWKQLIKQRLEGGMLSYTYKIRSTDVSQVSNNQITDIKASFRFMLQNANANYNVNNDTTFSKREETEWSIQVTFKPLNEFGNQSAINTNSLTSDEREYMEEISECLSDNNGSISNSQRRLLDKVRKALGISESRANELEAMCSAPQLTDDEKEYWEEYKECLNDGGVITSSERRLLERLRKSLGISEERAKEIENR